MREKDGAEEELYVSGKIVVHSRGNACKSSSDKENYTPSGRSLICSYTMETNVSHALWSEFNISPEENSGENITKGISNCFFFFLLIIFSIEILYLVMLKKIRNLLNLKKT